MFANPWFKPYWGEFQTVGFMSTANYPLSEADANVDHARGYTLPGKMVDFDHANMRVQFTTGCAYGLMEDKVSLNGALTDAQFLQFQRQTQVKDPPKRRGAMCAVRVYKPGSLLEFEGNGIASMETLVVTSGTGALASGTARLTELSVIKGGWRIAQAGELVLGLLWIPSLTPEDTVTPSLRIMVQIVSPYVK